jgi:hypothetical protein
MGDPLSFVFPFCYFHFVFSLVRSLHIFLGQAWAEGKGEELATCRHSADSGRELGKMYAVIVYIGCMRV